MDEMAQRLDEVNARADLARKIIKERYSWASVVDGYEKLFHKLTGLGSQA